MRAQLPGKLDPLVSATLRATGRRWQWLLFWRLLSCLVIFTAIVLLAFGHSMERGWISNHIVMWFVTSLLVLGFLAGVFACIVVAAVRRKPDAWLAGVLERRLPALADRLNTLAYLEGRPADRTSNAFYRGIGMQAGNELAKRPGMRPISVHWTAAFLVAAFLAGLGTWRFYNERRPWESIGSEGSLAAVADNAVEFALPEEGTSEVRQAWGEVRITEPGTDLKLTKVDVLQLTVEAASSQALRGASWSAAINGAVPAQHELPSPQEPNYAVYEPVLYLDELGLADWDILSYYAQASTDAEGNYASEVYFVEVRPFREDILKMEGGAGGEQGKAMLEGLKKLGRLIQKEQDILRQTHRQIQKPAQAKEQKEQDQEKLGAAQAGLRDATAHLYAEVAGVDHADIGTVLDQLALAQGSMEEAVGALRQSDNPGAMPFEQKALQELVEARKDMVKSISKAGEGGGESEETPPVADAMEHPADQLADIADFRDEGKAALAAVRAAKEEQEAIAKEAAKAKGEQLGELAERQKKTAEELQEFQEKVPGPFKGLEPSALAAKQAMAAAEEAMAADKSSKKGEGQTGGATQHAAESLGALETQLSGKLSQRALGDVYRMKSMMDSQSGRLEEMEKTPQQFSAEEVAKEVGHAKAAKDAMEQALEQTPAGEAFGPELGEALKGAPGKALDQAAEQMTGAGENSSAPGEAAGQAMRGLGEIDKAFEASKPVVLQAGAPEASQGEGDGSGMGEAARRLNSLIQRMAQGHATSPEDLAKQLEEARLAIVQEAQDHPEEAPRVLAMAEQLSSLKEEVDLNVNAEALRKLVDRLESFRMEVADHERPEPLDPKVLHADPAAAPSEFRERVRRYFEKLSDG